MTAAQPPVQVIDARRFGDNRGWFAEVYSEPVFAARGITARFQQDNHSFSARRYVLRGLHFQAPPYGQEKLVRCVRGSIFDVAVDVRKDSPTYGRWVGVELSAHNGRQLFIPVGFAHAFLTLEDNCEVTYKCSAVYAPEHDGGIRWDTAGVDWPLPADVMPELSEKDAKLPSLAEFDSPFPYDGRPLTPLT